MYIVITKNIVRKEGINEYIEASKRFVEDIKKQEGCINAIVCRDIKEKDCIVNIENWESKKVFEAYDGNAFLKHKAELKKNFINNTSLIFETV